MSFALQSGDHLVTAASPLLKARDRTSFDDAMSLLGQARAIRESARSEVAEARAQAVVDGRAEGLAAIGDALAAAVADLAGNIEEELAARRADIAAAALAATRAIIGTFDEADATARIASHAAARIAADEDITISVAPAMAAAVRARLADRAGATVRENPDAAPLDCVIQTGHGRVIASLPLQLSALAERWGVAGAGAPE